MALEKLSPASLKNNNRVIFASTTGDLPIPDKPEFLDWIEASHAFIGIRAACDTSNGLPEFVKMFGGEFQHHGPQMGVECLNEDPQNPATAHLGKTRTIQQEEIFSSKIMTRRRCMTCSSLTRIRKPMRRVITRLMVQALWRRQGLLQLAGHREDIIDADPGYEEAKKFR